VMSLWKKLSVWYSYARLHGYTNATLYALYKIAPKRFALLVEMVKKNPAATVVGSDSFGRLLKSVFRSGHWTDFGGSALPVGAAGAVETIVWFVPDWTNVWGGGHYTLFRFANHFARQGTHNVIYIYNNERHTTPHSLQKDLQLALDGCRLEVIIDPKKLPECAAAIATTWQSAYHVKAFPFAREKFYFMQDYESYFYAFGTASIQANETYSFGFHGITGGGWLRSQYQAHGGSAINYRFAADHKIFYPAQPDGQVPPTVKRLFFYGRPSTERRCFELGMASLQAIAARFPDVEIVIAGLDLGFTPPFKATLLGNMTLEDTGKLYRTCDVGIAFSATNLSYLPVELMASGVPVISNRGPQVEWHCVDRENSMLVEATPEGVLEAFAELYSSVSSRQRLADGGLATMRGLNWENEMRKVFEHVAEKIRPKANFLLAKSSSA
jgi:glycosyltransferase involved in cell wall biosynthesis